MNSEKGIGIIIDSSLTFREHMTENVNKANRVVGVKRNLHLPSRKHILSLYKAPVRLLLEYENQGCAPHLVKDIETIESVQQRATKCIPELTGMEYPERLRRLKLLTLAYSR